ncbi:sigma-70 family RNA polymerase sigma factor [bacterium]|nr:sigma-70 family RNA polymerase sigma factor [bacterium]
MKTQEIVEQIRQGNHKKLKKLYKYFPVVKKWLISRGCDKELARDIFQETLIVFCEKCRDEDFVMTSSVDTYLFSVSKFLYYNHARKAQREQAQDLNDLEIAASNDVDEWKEYESKLNIAERAFRELGEKCKQLLEMFYLHKKSMKEIASKLELRNEKVAKAQKYRCIKNVKEQVELLMNQA